MQGMFDGMWTALIALGVVIAAIALGIGFVLGRL